MPAAAGTAAPGHGGQAARPCRVVLVAPFGLRPKGTTSARVLPIARVLAAQGAQVRVVIPPWDDPGRSAQRWEDGGVELVHTTAGGGPLGAARIMSELLREARAFRPDVVHCFKPIGYSGAIASILTASARRRGAPLVVVDADDLEGAEGWSGRRRLGVTGAVRGAQETATLRNAPLVTVASTWLRDYARDLGRAEATMLSLPNGHQIEAAPAPRRGRQRGEASGNATCDASGPVLLWYTRFTEAEPGRAARLLAAALAAAAAARLVVVGEEINPGDRAAAAAALAAAGIVDRVEWHGFEVDAVEHWLRAGSADVVAVYPMDDDATNRARCPSKIPQLMALGVPIVAEAVGEIPHYLAGFEDDCLVPPGDAPTFAARVAALMDDRRRHVRVRRGLQAAADRWRWDVVAGGLLGWYARHLAVGR